MAYRAVSAVPSRLRVFDLAEGKLEGWYNSFLAEVVDKASVFHIGALEGSSGIVS
jgi:hypothetical protein